jgi:hypothetical protein
MVAVFINASGQQQWWRYSLMQVVSSNGGGIH